MNSLWQKMNALNVKLVLLFSGLTIISAFLTFTVLNYFIQEYRNNPPVVRLEVISSSEVFIRSKIIEQINEDRERLQQTIIILSAVIIITQILIATLGSLLIVNKSLEPLRKLNQTMKEINGLDLKSKIIKDNPAGEISQLIDNFNTMIGRIQDNVDKQKEFTQNISHELRTPLSAMRANLESVLLLSETDEDLRASINRSIESIDSLSKLINDLTLLSSLEKKDFVIEKFDAAECLKSTIEKVKQAFATNKPKIELEMNLEKFELHGSAELFDRAISNLIENSIKYSKKKPMIKIEVGKSGKSYTLRIKDNGFGIPKDKQERIFERFYRVDKSRNRSKGGSGLGLAISKEIIELFGGKLSIESSDSRGTTFLINILG